MRFNGLIRFALTVSLVLAVILPEGVTAAPAAKKAVKKTTSKKTTSVKRATVAVKATATLKTTIKVSSAKSTATSAAAVATSTVSSTASTASKIRGVNLGGWFIIEQWMKPSLFNAAATASGNASLATSGDQWSFMTSFKDKSKAKTLLQQHWSSWIVESDFAKIKSLGLNTVRLPVPHWAFVSTPSEPYLALAEQPYIANAIKLASKYGLGVILDMHTAPGSQNGYDSSGHTGAVNFRAVNGASNANILMTALQNMVKLYVNDAQYGGAVKSIEVLNEPLCYVLGADYMTQIYYNAYNAVKSAISASAPVKPTVIFHDCFIEPIVDWSPAVSAGGGLANIPFTFDSHRYQVFAPFENLNKSQQVSYVKQFGQEIADGTAKLNRQVIVGEFSLAISCTDCVPAGSTSADIATLNRQWFETQTTAYERGAGWIFWNWVAEGPNLPWSFKDAYAANWIPAVITLKNEAL